MWNKKYVAVYFLNDLMFLWSSTKTYGNNAVEEIEVLGQF